MASRMASYQLRTGCILVSQNSRRLVCRCTSSTTAQLGTAPMEPQHRPRKPVVTAIITRESDGKLLLVKRSAQVGTYQHYMGGVSGGVEGNESLLHRALQEISEEVGFSPQQLQLITCGRALTVDDGRRHFLVYPFLFKLLDAAAAVTLNWENEGYEWVAASAVPQLQHVPLLPETVRRLLLPPYMASHVAYLHADRQHGAAELAAYVLQAVRAALAYEDGSALPVPVQGSTAPAAAAAVDTHPQQQQMRPPPLSPPPQQQQSPEVCFDHWLEAHTNFCFQMAVCRPSMAAVANTAADVMLQLQQELKARADPFEPTVGVARLAMSDALDKLSAAMQQQQEATISNAAAVLQSGMCVLTTSLSSTVAKALIQAHQRALQEQQQPAAAEAAGASTVGTSIPLQGAGSAGAARQTAQSSTQQAEQSSAAAAPQDTGQPDWGSADWVDDPKFWPSMSGVGREQPGGSGTFPPFLTTGGGSSSSYKGSSRGPGLSVIVCESRPLCEGVTMAQRLTAAGLHVTLITDAQAGVFAEQADVVLLGADAVSPAGVVNKVGSRLLALAAKAADVPVVAVTDSLKVTPGPVSQFALPNTVLQAGEEEKAVSELLQAWGQDTAAAVMQLAQQRPQQQQQVQEQSSQLQDSSSAAPTTGSLELRNVYFEAVPLSLVSAVVTDRGVLDRAQVAELMESRAKGYEQAFGLALPDDMLRV